MDRAARAVYLSVLHAGAALMTQHSLSASTYRALAGPDPAPVEWRIEPRPVAYEDALALMEKRVADIASGSRRELIWLLEHPPLYTAGTSARAEELVDPRFPVHWTGRGGRFTYHGPGQRVVYVMLDLKRRRPDLRLFVRTLENWIIATLDEFGIAGRARDDRVGVWVERPDKPRGAMGQIAEDKIAAIGVRVRRWIAFHGLSLNVAPDLAHFSGIVPCGVADAHLGVTSLADLGARSDMNRVDEVLRRQFERLIGPTQEVGDDFR